MVKKIDIAITLNFSVFFSFSLGDPNPDEKRKFMREKNVMNRFLEGSCVVQFSLSLNQSLVTATEDEARWMIKNKLTTEKTVPNFSDYIYEDALKPVKPEAVNIIR